MSLESRYDAIVKDTLSLLQEALYRFFSDSTLTFTQKMWMSANSNNISVLFTRV